MEVRFGAYSERSIAERVLALDDSFRQHLNQLLVQLLEQAYQQLAVQPLNNYSIQTQTVELLLRLNSHTHHKDILAQAY